jgi:hypothetical protein
MHAAAVRNPLPQVCHTDRVTRRETFKIKQAINRRGWMHAR